MIRPTDLYNGCIQMFGGELVAQAVEGYDFPDWTTEVRLGFSLCPRCGAAVDSRVKHEDFHFDLSMATRLTLIILKNHQMAEGIRDAVERLIEQPPSGS